MTRLLRHTVPKITNTGKAMLTEFYPNRLIIPDKPYILEKQFENGLRYTRKPLSNGSTLEVFEDTGTTHKVLLDIYDNPVAVNTIKDGKKRTSRFLAGSVYSHIISKFFDKTREFVNLR